MSNNKQSSVELLFHKLWDTPKDKFTWYAILEEHKAKHKEEIIDAHTIGYVIGGGNGDLHESKEYYNERFGEQQDTEYGSYKEVIEMVQSLDFKTILKQYAETEEGRQTIAEMNKAMGVKVMTMNNNNIPGTITTSTPDNNDNTTGLDLNKLRDRLDNVLNNETADGLNEWMKYKRDMTDEQIARIQLVDVLDNVQSIMHDLTLDELDALIDELTVVYERFSDMVESRSNN